MKFVKFLALSIAALSMVACGPANEDNGGGGFITQEFTKVYCDVTATGWTTVGVWAWTDATDEAEGQNFTGGTWPGVALTTTETIEGTLYYIWEAPKELVGQTIGFIVNQFVDGGEQTVDLKNLTIKAEGNFVVLTEKGADGKWLAKVDGQEPVVPEPEPEKPAPSIALADHTWDVAGSFNDWGATLLPMTVADGWAVATFDAPADAQFKVRADGAWTDSYGVTDNSNLPVDGSEFDAIYNAGNLKVTEAGNYTLSFTVNGEVGKFKLKKN
ncbi:MAG: hypothetical protein IKL67_07060 [Tidjanibacter sp.]|nr:hypothetical protein [Tidjanibacter sp.]